MPDWLSTAKGYYAKVQALYEKYNFQELEDKRQAAFSTMWSIRSALIVCPAKSIEDMTVKALAFREQNLNEMELVDARALLSIIRDLEAMQEGGQSCAA